jgi:hypothetical protein
VGPATPCVPSMMTWTSASSVTSTIVKSLIR